MEALLIIDINVVGSFIEGTLADIQKSNVPEYAPRLKSRQ